MEFSLCYILFTLFVVMPIAAMLVQENNRNDGTHGFCKWVMTLFFTAIWPLMVLAIMVCFVSEELE